MALVSRVESQLRDLFIARCDAGDFNQAKLAEKLGVNRSVVNRRLTGRSNMTLETLADMVWGVGGCIDVDIFDPAERHHLNHPLAQDVKLTWAASEEPAIVRPLATQSWSMTVPA